MKKKVINIIHSIPGWLSEKEAEFLTKIAKKTEKNKGEIVEIGSFYGKSTICLAQGKGKVYAIDPHKGFVENNKKYPPTYKGFLKSIKSAKVKNKIVPIVMRSKDASKNWKRKIKVLFIDGLHDEKSAFQDYELFSKHLTDKGIVAVHDSFMRWCGSEKMAINKIVNSPEFYKIGVVGSIIYGIKGKGSFFDVLNKTLWRVFIITIVNLNHLQIIVINFPDIIKNKLLPRYYIVL